MDEQIINLINMALADGEVTEKERNIIFKKALALGYDQDEVEMILDGKIALMEKEANLNVPIVEKPKLQKHGNIKKCPSCGAGFEAMALNCTSCGHEFISTKSNATILELLEKLEKIEDEINKACLNKRSAEKFEITTRYKEKIDNTIKNFPIPNTKEDILEFLTYAVSKASGMQDSLGSPWKIKSSEIIMKSRLLFKNDNAILNKLNDYENQIKKATKKGITIIIVSLIIIVLMAIVAMAGTYFFTN